MLKLSDDERRFLMDGAGEVYPDLTKGYIRDSLREDSDESLYTFVNFLRDVNIINKPK